MIEVIRAIKKPVNICFDIFTKTEFWAFFNYTP